MPGAALGGGAAVAGFFGKIPARGDFVRAGLPRSFIDPWDAWMAGAIAGSRVLLGPRWLACWLEAPIWRFVLPEGACGPDAACGVWLPSVDSAGRHFPLAFARLGPADAGFLVAAEAAGLAALEQDLAPEALAALLGAAVGVGAVLPDLPGAGQLWWTDGSPHVPPGRLVLAGLPDAATFAAMLCAEPAVAPDGGLLAGGERE